MHAIKAGGRVSAARWPRVLPGSAGQHSRPPSARRILTRRGVGSRSASAALPARCRGSRSRSERIHGLARAAETQQHAADEQVAVAVGCGERNTARAQFWRALARRAPACASRRRWRDGSWRAPRCSRCPVAAIALATRVRAAASSSVLRRSSPRGTESALAPGVELAVGGRQAAGEVLLARALVGRAAGLKRRAEHVMGVIVGGLRRTASRSAGNGLRILRAIQCA